MRALAFSGIPRRAGNTRKEGSLCNILHAADSWGVWAWTGGAAAAVMDLEGQGVGGGTVATTTSHSSTYSRLDYKEKLAR